MTISRRTVLGALLATAAAPPRTDYAIEPRLVADGIWVVAGADAPIERDNGGAIANITIIATPAGTVLVDCGPSFRYAKTLGALAERLTGKPVVRVYLTHLHPDHGLGIAAFDQPIVAALPATIAGIESDGQGFSDSMYRLLGDWMRGTDLVKPGVTPTGDAESFGGRRLRLLALSGHSAGDLALLDEATGVLVTGDLVFNGRAPSTPTADLATWRQSLDVLAALPHRLVIPGHGAIDPGGTAAITQTRDWLDWLDESLRAAVKGGLDMVEAGTLPLPERFAGMAAVRYELQRSVSHFYPVLEAELLPRIDVAE